PVASANRSRLELLSGLGLGAISTVALGLGSSAAVVPAPRRAESETLNGAAAAAPGNASSPLANVSVASYVESAVVAASSNVTRNEAPVPASGWGGEPVTEKWPSPPVIAALVTLSRAWSTP